MPLVIGVHTAVPLLVAGTERYLLVPNLPLAWSFLGGVLGLAQIAIAPSFVYGFLTRPASVLLMVTPQARSSSSRRMWYAVACAS